MSNTLRVDLLSNVAATGGWFKWPGGKGTLFARGTFGGATVSLETNTNPAAAPGAEVAGAVANTGLTANGAINFELPPCDIRGAVAGGAPANLFAHAVRINP